LAHDQPGIARATEAVLNLRGFEVEIVRTSEEVEAALVRRRFDALVVDVALREKPAYELVSVARSSARDFDRGARVVILVSSVYRKTSYKRRPARLYGADDYVEIHHLCDMLPAKLQRLLALCSSVDESARADAETRAARVLRAEGESRLRKYDPQRMAASIVADVVLYNGEAILGASDIADARRSVDDDLSVARDLLAQLAEVAGEPLPGGDPVGEAFERIMRELGRGGSMPP